MMASKIPVISTKEGAVTELIENNKEGILINRSAPNELVCAIKRLIENRNDYETIRNNGYNKILINFNLGTMIARYIDIYEKVNNLGKT